MEIPTGINSLASGSKVEKKSSSFHQFRRFGSIYTLNDYSTWDWFDKIQYSHNFSFGKMGGLRVTEIFFFSLNKTFLTCSVTPGSFTRIRGSCSLTLLIYSSAPGRPASHSYCGLEPPRALNLGEDGWRSDPAAAGGGGSRKQAPGRVIHPNGNTEVGSGGAGSHPNKVRGRDALPFSARIPVLPPSCWPLPVPN